MVSKYKSAVLEVVHFSVEDIITDSAVLVPEANYGTTSFTSSETRV